MKRSFIIALVVLVHVLLLLWLIGGMSGRPETPSKEQTNDPATAPSDLHINTRNTDNGTGPGDKSTPNSTSYHASKQPLTALTFHSDSTLRLPADLQQESGLCRTGLLVDWSAQKILWEKRSTEAVPIASMTKMMTALLLIEEVKSDPLMSLQTPVKATRSAAAVGGRQIYVDFRETFTVEELLKCMMIFSANDVAYLTAEFLSGGDVSAFVNRMNSRAQQLGMTKAHFYTPHGLPSGSGHDKATARELAFLAAQLVRYPEVVRWASTWLDYIRQNSERFEPFQLVNTNRLIKEVDGVNGMKTGYTDDAGFCITATCQRNKRLIIAVVTGCPSADARNDLVKDLLNWGYTQ